MARDESSVTTSKRVLRARLARPLPGPRPSAASRSPPRDPDGRPTCTPADRAPGRRALILLHPDRAGPWRCRSPCGTRRAASSRAGQSARRRHRRGRVPGRRGRPRSRRGNRRARRRDVRVVGALSTVWVPRQQLRHPPIRRRDRRDTGPSRRIRRGERDHRGAGRELRDPAPSQMGTDASGPMACTSAIPISTSPGRLIWGATAIVLGEFVCLFDEAYPGSFGPPTYE